MLSALVGAGIDEQTPPPLAKRLRLANQVALFQTAVCLFFAGTSPLHQTRAAALGNLAVCLGCGFIYLCVLGLNHLRRPLVARFLLLFLMCFGMAASAVVSPRSSGTEYLLLAFSPMPLLLFGREERRYLLLWVMAPAALFFVSVLLRDVLPLAARQPPFPSVLRWLMDGSCFATLLWQISVLYRENARSEEELGRARDLALAASQQKSEFLANMSHEIRTPLTAILGFADLLAESAHGPDRQHVETIRRNGQHLLRVLSDILDLSKIEAGRMVVERLPCSVGQIVMEVASLMQVRARDKRLTFEARLLGPVPETICSDPTRLRQILLNLVGNAIKFTESGGVRLEIFREGPAAPPEGAPGPATVPEHLCFSVRDSGIGLSEEQLGRLFQAFTQADASMTRRFGGTGLGLVICQRLSAMLGGRIDVESEPGRGSTFTLRVDPGPLEGVRLIDRLALQRETVPARPVKVAGQLAGIQVLLAEDGRDNQLLISTILRKAGATVTLADNGRVALEKAQRAAAEERPFAVILMDMQMPEMDGYEATRALRKGGYGLPIVALTAHAMAGDRERCLQAGCDDYLTKPISQSRLIQIARRVARLDGPPPP